MTTCRVVSLPHHTLAGGQCPSVCSVADGGRAVPHLCHTPHPTLRPAPYRAPPLPPPRTPTHHHFATRYFMPSGSGPYHFRPPPCLPSRAGGLGGLARSCGDHSLWEHQTLAVPQTLGATHTQFLHARIAYLTHLPFTFLPGIFFAFFCTCRTMAHALPFFYYPPFSVRTPLHYACPCHYRHTTPPVLYNSNTRTPYAFCYYLFHTSHPATTR